MKPSFGVITDTGPINAEIPVTAPLRMGSERLVLHMTNNGIIVSHLGKRGVAGLAALPLLGKLGMAMEDIVKKKREDSRTRGLRSTPREILTADKENFYIPFSEIVQVELEEFPRAARIQVLTDKDKLEFLTLTSFERLKEQFEGVLGTKVTVRKV